MGPPVGKIVDGSDMLQRPQGGMGPPVGKEATGATFSAAAAVGAYPPWLKEIGGMGSRMPKVSHRPSGPEELLSRTDLDGLWDRVPEVQHAAANWGKGNA